MAKAKKKIASPARLEGPINPDLLYRLGEARPYFGLKPTQLAERIKSGDIPPPVKLTASGNACGWFGRQILEWQQKRIAASAKAVAS